MADTYYSFYWKQIDVKGQVIITSGDCVYQSKEGRYNPEELKQAAIEKNNLNPSAIIILEIVRYITKDEFGQI